MPKHLYDAMVSELESSLGGMVLDLISLEDGEKKNENGTELYTRAELEIPRGCAFSRCRFTCKLPRWVLPLSEEELDAGVSVMVHDLKVTFISSNREIYTKGSGLKVIE